MAEQLQDPIFEKERRRAMNYALRLLSYRGRAQKELKERLKMRGYSEAVINTTIESLKEMSLIDDKKFAMLFAQDRLNLAKRGIRAIYAELLKKGVPKPMVTEAISQIKQDEITVAKNLIEKYRKRYARLEPENQKKKLHDLLLRRGFSFPTIEAVLGLY